MLLQEYITDIAAGPFGSNLKVSCFVEKGFPIIDGANLKGYKVTDNITKFVTEEKARSLHRSIAKRGDIVVTISGNVGQISYIPDDSEYEEYLVSQRQFRATFDRDRVNVAFLVYYFHTREGQHKILSFANQVGVPALAQPLKNFKNISIELPSKDRQDAIAAYIDNIEDKIAINHRICENLEAQAQALFKHWFIDFAPFKNGKFVESDLGMIPEGWRVTTFSEVFDLGPGGTPKTSEKTFWEGGAIPFFSPKDVSGVYCFETEKHITEKGLNNCSSRLYDKNTVFITCRGTVGKVALAAIPMAMNQSNYAILSKKGYSQYFAYLMTLSIVKKLKFKANGAVFDAITSKDFKEQIIIPNSNVVNRFDSIIKPIFDSILNLGFQNLRLATLRDTLLPKLMSGQIKL